MLRQQRRSVMERANVTCFLLVMCSTGIVAAPCSTTVSREWLVRDTASATALAEAVNCTGGTFHVEWSGSVVVAHEIYIADGTSVRVTGADSEARMDGDGETRLFTVINASLEVSNMQIGNGHANVGGAIASNGSSMSFDQTSFIGNIAIDSGGALHVVNNSIVFWGGLTTFFNNTAGYVGGAVDVNENSSVSWEAETSFLDNTADYGGAVYVSGGSRVFWEAETSFSGNNASSGSGGAVYVGIGSSVSWEAGTSFSNNTAGYGGAVYVSGDSNASWEAQTSFSDNTADRYGAAGAVHVYDGSRVSWEAKTSFSGNIATIGSGGAVHLEDGCSASWEAKTSFTNNTADYGGAVFVSGGSNASWEAQTSFSDNIVGKNGGAVLVFNESSVSWEAPTSFSGNSAGKSGGALLVEYRSNASWEADTDFLRNHAASNGGAVSIGSSVSGNEESSSSLVINGKTTFLRNTCEARGGGMAIISAASATIQTGESVTFTENSADVAGGAVFVSGVGMGPQFVGISFISNSAHIGGAVYVTGSGTAVENNGYDAEFNHPTTFNRSKFINNKATATGGAVDSSAGLDVFNNTLFEGNSARVGGALRLAGTSSLHNCIFVENTSDKDEGPAISNIGYISSMSMISFVDNVFECEPGTFLNLSQSGDVFDIVCEGCTNCSDCKSNGKLPSCTNTMEHSTSPGGNITLEMVLIDRGYWRATNTSTDVLACYNADACLGNTVTGTPDYCQDGYEGPYCSICSKGYTVSLGFSCNKCSDNTVGIVLLVVIALLAMIAFAAFISYMMSVEEEGADRGIVTRVTRYIPLQSLKMVIVAWQILTQFSRVANVTYPDVYQEFLDGVDVLNFDLSWILSTGCIFDMDFHARLLASTIGPLIGASILGATYLISMRRNRESSSSAVGIVRQKHLSMVLLLTFVVYSSVSSTLFQVFACETLDDGKYYLRADYRIECDSSRHEALQVYAGFMIVLYPVGIPVFYATLLFRNRDVLTDGDGRKVDERVKSTTDLWKPYKPDRFHYEVIECGRRILLTGVVVFIYPDTAPQVAVTILISGFFVFVSEALAPFESRWDTWVSRMGHAVVFLSMYVALLLKVDLSNERANGQRIFEVILVSAHACMISAVIIESIVLAYALRRQHADIHPRFSFSLRAEDDAAQDIPRPHYVDDVETEPNVDQRKENQGNSSG